MHSTEMFNDVHVEVVVVVVVASAATAIYINSSAQSKHTQLHFIIKINQLRGC